MHKPDLITRHTRLSQFIASSLMGILMTLSASFAAMPGDLNEDDKVNLKDWALFEACFNGVAHPVDAGCEGADLDSDGDVDRDDELLLAANFNGSENQVSGVQLNEIGFLPRDDEFQFVELLIGQDGIDLTGFQLISDSHQYELPEGIGPVVAGDIVLVVFDDANTVEGLTVHADRVDFLNTESDAVRLFDPVGNGELDAVAWGSDRAGAIPLGRSGLIGPPTPGMTLGRRPQTMGFAPNNWLAYDPVEASPGQANPYPGVPVLHPANGTLLELGEPLNLNWFPVPEAQAYLIQVATDRGFAQIVFTETVQAPVVTAPSLAEGTYYWRVKVIYAEDRMSAFSRVHTLWIRSIPKPISANAQFSPVAISASTIKTLEPFPSLSQHKDTDMILLESRRLDAGHRYDQAHETLDRDDPADNTNCALASIAMINRFFGGNLSQDRIGFFVFSESAPGAEWDLNYNRGLDCDQITAALSAALGGVDVNETTVFDLARRADERNLVWNELTAEIDEGHPVLVTIPGHAMVLVGYETHTFTDDPNDLRLLVIYDPWYPDQSKARRRRIVLDASALDGFYRINGTVESEAVTLNDPSIGLDSDRDGINDFDEQNRFGTSWERPGDSAGWDTDRDCLRDKEEIELSLFDPTHGYALWVNGSFFSDGTARDSSPYDNIDTDDTFRPERDNDSDNGGLPDFMEDLNRDGFIDVAQGESNPFDPDDDARVISGTIQVQRNQTQDNGTQIRQSFDIQVDLRTEADGRVSGFAACTYNDRHIIPLDAAPPQCPEPRVRETVVDELSGNTMVEGEFICQRMADTRAPMLSLREVEPFLAFANPSVTFIDPCLGNSSGSVVGTIFLFRSTTAGSDQAEGFEFNVSQNRVEWKYRSPIREGLGLFTDYDIVMTP